MPFTGQFITIAALCKVVLPSRTLRLSDGGIVTWGSETYTASDSIYGSIAGGELPTETVGDEAPSGRLTLMPPSISAATDLFQANAQGSAMQFWMTEVNTATGLVTGTPQLLFSGFLDSMSISAGRGTRSVDIEFVAQAERFFSVAEGNVLSSRFQNALFPGEKGLDYATNALVSVAWGVAAPQRGTFTWGIGGGGAGGGAGGIGSGFNFQNSR